MTRRSTLFLDLEKELEELRMNVDSDSWMEGIPPENIKKFLGSLSNISDERHQSYITYSVQEILFICFFAVLSNSNTWTEIGEFAVRKRKWLGCFFDEIAAHTRDFSHELAAKKTYVVKKQVNFLRILEILSYIY